MRRGIRTDIDWALVGAELANADAHEQALALNSMAKEMLSWETRHQAEIQVAAIVSCLKPETKELLVFNS